MEPLKNSSNREQPTSSKSSVISETGLLGLTIKGVKYVGKKIWQHRREIAGGMVAAANATKRQYEGLAGHTKYRKKELDSLQHVVEAQGGYYREVMNKMRPRDTVAIGGESLIAMLSANIVSTEVIAAYAAAYPDLAANVEFTDHIRSLSEAQLPGFIAGVKGKLFELRYVDYLNSGVLPDEYTASIATIPNQPGWDIGVSGPDGELVNTIQAKATDSISYVKEAIERYPAIDVVTTDEVYSHLVMSGINEGLMKGQISNAELTDHITTEISDINLDLGFSPPIFTLAFIAFTSYRDEGLAIYKKAQSFGDRSAKAYFSYIFGGSIAAITSTWWLGVVGSTVSHYLTHNGLKKYNLGKQLERTIKINQEVIQRLQKQHRPT